MKFDILHDVTGLTLLRIGDSPNVYPFGCDETARNAAKQIEEGWVKADFFRSHPLTDFKFDGQHVQIKVKKLAQCWKAWVVEDTSYYAANEVQAINTLLSSYPGYDSYSVEVVR